ncbi:YoaK family protein [Enterococcus sp. ZJ1668]|uniref:YoaK family protein n=1 Tax=Enterococcus sp. ZJ1668 TaxID=2709402 RepID=UPI0013EC2F87|nr:YoaK family protein [Enterococcus sp. ZJ1668]
MRTSFHEDRTVGLLLTFIGGAMDSYTYIQYNAFASAQTGNIVLAIIQGFDGEWVSVGKKILSTLFFFLGILLTKYLIDYFKKKEKHFWRLFVLYYEALVFFLISLAPIHAYPALVTILIAFTAAIQWISFDKINGRAYTNLFTTGNLKGVATNLYDFLISREKADFDRFFHYLTVVLSFIAGAVVLVFCHHLFGASSILVVSILFLLLALFQSFQLWRFYKTI